MSGVSMAEEAEPAMNRCRKRLSVVFGLILAVAALVAPFRETQVTYRRSPGTTLISKETRQRHGYALVFGLLRDRERAPDLEALASRTELWWGRPLDSGRRSLNLRGYLLQVGAVAVLGALDIWIFCIRRRRI